jgi:hypothetical protein
MPQRRVISRRSLLARLLAWGGAAGILPPFVTSKVRADGTPGYGIDTPITMPGGPPDRMRGRLFEQHLNSSFQIVPDPASAPPKLILVPPAPQHSASAKSRTGHVDQPATPLFIPDPQAAPRTVVLTSVTISQTITNSRRKASSTPRYSLIFREVKGPALLQGTYRVEHPQLGVFPLFLVPIGPKQGDVLYQAIFG